MCPNSISKGDFFSIYKSLDEVRWDFNDNEMDEDGPFEMKSDNFFELLCETYWKYLRSISLSSPSDRFWISSWLLTLGVVEFWGVSGWLFTAFSSRLFTVVGASVVVVVVVDVDVVEVELGVEVTCAFVKLLFNAPDTDCTISLRGFSVVPL